MCGDAYEEQRCTEDWRDLFVNDEKIEVILRGVYISGMCGE